MKKKITVTVDSEIVKMLNQHLDNLKIGNKSKFIEKLIKEELNKKR